MNDDEAQCLGKMTAEETAEFWRALMDFIRRLPEDLSKDPVDLEPLI